MVNRRQKTGKMMFKIGLRTILKDWLQFLAIILINVVATTLFVGLCSNADNIEKRVDTLYEGSNIADIWTNVTSSDEQDKNAIDTIVGEHGYTETRYSMSAEIASRNMNALMSEELPTINAPYLCDNVQKEDFFIIDNRLFNDERHPETWNIFINEDGYYRSMDVKFNFANINNILTSLNVKSVIDEYLPNVDGQIEEIIEYLPEDIAKEVHKIVKDIETINLLDVFDICLKDESSINIFDSSTLTLNFQITGSMMFAENVQSSLMNSSNFILDMDLFKNKLKESIDLNFANPNPILGEKNFIWKLLIKETGIFNSMVDSIIDSFTYNTYCTKLFDKEYEIPVEEAIQNYFASKPSSENNLILCSTIDSLLSNVTIQNDIKQARQLAYIFPIVFFLVAILVVLTTFSQLILKERTQIGTLKAMGVSKGRIILHYLLLTTIIMAVGSILGCIIGPILLSLIMNVKYAILYTLPAMTYVIAIPEALISTFAIILMSSIVTLLVTHKEVRLNPAYSIRPAAPKAIKSKALSNSKKPIGLAIKMAFRNIRVNITKSLMVVIGVMGCTALLVCGFGVDDTLKNGVNHDLEHYYGSDITLTYSVMSSHKDEILSLENVSDIEEYAVLPSSIKGEDSIYETRVFCLQDDSSYFLMDNGYILKDEVAISQKVADAMNLKIGDEIFFSVPLIRNEYFHGVVGAINESFYIHGIYVNENFQDYKELSKYTNNAFVKVDDSTKVNETGDNIKALGFVQSYETSEGNRETISGYMSSIALMTLAIKVFAIILAIVVLYNLALLNFKERIRDIATLKVLGFNQMEIMLSLIIEIMVLTIVGIVFGLFLGKPLEIIVLMVNRTPLVEFLYTVFPLTYGISFGITFGTAFIVNLILSLKTKNVKMVESLKSVD